ncbi:glycosyltransferase family 4 protein [Sphingomonas sp. KRR8]|uniref:glycosyltransferase family 4 protein n=1 Tax=Sphingomonas sp. KRR8 TaxID=2942996 RepID=UPI002021ACEF|nr:glycosyltransferase family 1 protein [Sphingomonas sp. KRR8]URD61960.1 glycosyltransferase family 4 protein [Sphingomonas sp. KRR8]
MAESTARLDHGSLEWLLSLEQERFIAAVFEALLGRSPDPTGIKHYLSLLERKKNKLQVISDLYHSAEAKARPQRTDVIEAVFRHDHPLLSRVIKAPRRARSMAPLPSTPSPPASLLAELDHHIRARHEELLNAIHGKGNVIQDKLLQLEYILESVGRSQPDEALGDPRSGFIFNLSTSNHWRTHPVGIVRVEREIAAHLQRFRNVDFVLWDKSSRCLKKLPSVHAERILTPAWCDPASPMLEYDPGQFVEPIIRPGDTYISLGLDWDHAPVDQVLAYLRRFEAKAVLACYDTVPTQFPEFLVREEIGSEFRHHLVDMAHGASKVWAISEATKRDLLGFWDSARLEREPPPVTTVPLASFCAPSDLPQLNERERGVLRDVFVKGEYVLYVSSVEPRKNHKLMLDIWRELWEERGVDCPQFVFVGMRGWGTEDLLQRTSRMAAYRGGKITGLHHVSDELLAHLYHHCSFTVFPSHYEGWGLAATEAMAFGKVCVIANNSSLGEATQGLMPAHHPLDFPAWKAEIERLLDDVPYRQSLEASIAANYRPLTWADVGEAFCNRVLMDDQR